ncbi:MAG: hypothetical protein U0K57_04830 [Lachnospiraceae bacterium]|nr:hypothetical protein [Lachnospiraceae bacterium]
MEQFLRSLVIAFARAHSYILSLNDAYEQNFSDKELHFLVIGLIGMALVAVIYPLFQALSHDHVLVIVFIYVFTLILVLTFAIEIGQGYSGTGTMDFADIEFGVVGFLLFFAIFALIRTVVIAIIDLVRGLTGGKRRR